MSENSIRSHTKARQEKRQIIAEALANHTPGSHFPLHTIGSGINMTDNTSDAGTVSGPQPGTFALGDVDGADSMLKLLHQD